MSRIFTVTLLTLLAILPRFALAGDPQEVGTVEFAFDGGTLKCEFGANNRELKRHVALIVHPASASTDLKRLGFAPIPGSTSSTVLIAGPDGKYQLLSRQTATGWAKRRIAEMSARPSSAAENAFVAAVMHTLSTGDPVRVWANDGVDLLQSGKWSGLFDTAPKPPDGFPDSGPFADPADDR